MKNSKKIIAIVSLIIIVGVLFFQIINHSGPFKGNHTGKKDKKSMDRVHVDRVVDGDTFVAHDQQHHKLKVRLIGVDTPETVKPHTAVQPYGKKASNYSKSHLTNKNVYLEYDQEKHDQYGRTLAYVWMDKKNMYNQELIEKGLAREKYYAPNNKYRSLLEKEERHAQQKNINIWAS